MLKSLRLFCLIALFRKSRGSALYGWIEVLELLFNYPTPPKAAKSKELMASIKKISTRAYLEYSLKNMSEGNAKVFEDPVTLILKKLSESKGFYDLTLLNQNEIELLSNYPVFNSFQDLRKLKVKVSFDYDGLIKWSNLVKLDPVTGIVYRNVNIMILQNDAVDLYGCIVVLPSLVKQNSDLISYDISFKENQESDWIPYQRRIRLYINAKILDSQTYNGPKLLELSVFEQKSYPKMLQEPVLARYDLPENSAKNHYIYLSVDEFRKRLDEKGKVVDSNILASGAIVCLWFVAGGPGGKVSGAHKIVDLLSSSILKGSSDFEEVRILFIEHRGIGHLERLTIASRIKSHGERWERSRLLKDSTVIPVDQYGSTASAKDIISVVEKYTKTLAGKALHIGLGGSYGSRTMGKAIRLNPEIFHTAILSGVSHERKGNEVQKEISGSLRASKAHPLFSAYRNVNEKFESLVIKSLDNFEVQGNQCKSDLRRLYPIYNKNSDMILTWAHSTHRKDLILLLLLFYDRCPSEPLTKRQICRCIF